ncbi:hypothetical protein [Sporosarcina sp. USHLN248]|uniref:hypothetical protein n=1 Tax=Sporosarcina sp. USHLN248 TaxID=3081300 RepID=UPI00301AAFB5
MKFQRNLHQATPYIILLSLLLMNVLLASGVIKLLFGGSNTIIAGVIGFIGAVIGGALTLIGVKWTLSSQIEKENDRKFESNKTFLSASKTIFNFDKADKIGRLDKHRVLITEPFKILSGHIQDTAYYSVIRYGGNEI